jgi:FkbM family methyltransferase
MARYAQIAALAGALQAARLIAVGFKEIAQPNRRQIVLLDIGARGGLSKPWQLLYRLGAISPIFVEPDADAAEAIQQRYPEAKIIRSALWSSCERRQLYVTAQPGCSSLLAPEPDERMPRSVKAMLELTSTFDVDTQVTKAALSSLNITPDIIKIDVQGGELEVLRGLGDAIASVQCVEVEVSFIKGYRDQPLFNEIYDFLCLSGFGLFDVQAFGVFNTRNAVQANAYFCRQSVATKRAKNIEAIFCAAAGFSHWH